MESNKNRVNDDMMILIAANIFIRFILNSYLNFLLLKKKYFSINDKIMIIDKFSFQPKYLII